MPWCFCAALSCFGSVLFSICSVFPTMSLPNPSFPRATVCFSWTYARFSALLLPHATGRFSSWAAYKVSCWRTPFVIVTWSFLLYVCAHLQSCSGRLGFFTQWLCFAFSPKGSHMTFVFKAMTWWWGAFLDFLLWLVWLFFVSTLTWVCEV